MVSAVKWIIGSGVILCGGVIGATYTNPTWTQRKFDPKRNIPFMHNNPPSREVCLQKLKFHDTPDKALDVLVIGGGSVGTGVALDAVTRGLDVGLVEMCDYAAETSSRSTKLIHGGIRYLEKAVFQLDLMQLKLVAEALKERSIILHQAPHICHELPTLIPCYNPYEMVMFWGGAKFYDFIAALYGGTIQYSGYVFPGKVRRLYPNLLKRNSNNSPLLGAVRYYDGQMNDARLCFTVAMTAASYGAAMVNYAEVKKMERVDNSAEESLMRTTVVDRQTNHKFTVYSKSIINASGPFASKVENLTGRESSVVNVPAAGTHIMVGKEYCPRDNEALVITSSDGRIVFTIPWLGGCLLGTTDRKAEVVHDPKSTTEDVTFLLDNVKDYIDPIPRDAVKSAWAGIRPLAKLQNRKDSGGTENMVREHVITVTPQSLMVTVTGGKWTTYRHMAEQTVDKLRDTVMKGRALFKPCCTDHLILFGARNLSSVPEKAPGGIPDDVHEHWRANYGDRYHQILALANQNDQKLAKRLTENSPVVEAEVLWASQNEHCEHVVDFLCRRTRMAFINVLDAEAAIPRVTELMAQAKKWSGSTINAEKAMAYAAMDSFREPKSESSH